MGALKENAVLPFFVETENGGRCLTLLVNTQL